MSTYDDEAAALLKEMGVEFSVRYVGNACPRFCTDLDDMSEAGKFPRKKHIHGDQHLCTLSRPAGIGVDDQPYPAKIATFDFWNSYRDQSIAWMMKNPGRAEDLCIQPWKSTHGSTFPGSSAIFWAQRTKFSSLPTAYSLLACLQKSDVGTFKYFCSDFGYSDDSIKAMETYRAVQEEFEKVRWFFTSPELERLQDIA